MSAGGSSSRQRSNQSQSQQSFIAPTQLPFLSGLWEQAMGINNPQATADAAQQASNFILPGLESVFTNTTALSNPALQIAAQTQGLQAGLGQLFREEINPAITGSAIAAGGFGGARQGVAQGVAAGQLGQVFAQGLGDIVARANQTALGAASLTPGIGEAITAARALPTVAGFDPLTRLAQIIGAPTVLATGEAKARSRGRSGGFSFGLF